MAREYVQFLQDAPKYGNCNLLADVVNEIAQKGEKRAGRGLIVGFFGTLGQAMGGFAVLRSIVEKTV